MGSKRAYEKFIAGLTAPDDAVFRYLSDDGTTAGEKNAIGNYSGGGLGETFFHIEAEQGETLALYRMLIKIRDGGPFSADDYAGITSGLSTGMLAQVREPNDDVVLDLTDGEPIQIVPDWARLCHDTSLFDFGSGDDFISVRWTFANSGSPLILTPGRKFGMLMRDDMSALDAHFFHVQGIKGKIGR